MANGATFSRLHTWALDEVIRSADLNAEFNNILNNLNPAGLDGYSDNTATMQIQTSPGGVGTESLATSLAGEIERLRFVIARIAGTTYWYSTPASSIASLVAALGTGLPSFRISSGVTSANSSQLIALIPSGSTASLTLTASSVTPFQYYINGSAYSITASQTITGLALASGSNAAAQIPANADVINGQQFTKAWGMYDTVMPVVTAGVTFAASQGSIAAFAATAATTEYFLGQYNGSSGITNAWRGCFFTAGGTWCPAVGIATSSNIALMKLGWVFANSGGSLAVTYDNPVVAGVAPAAPNTGDYWFNTSTTMWMTFGSGWQTASATLIGMAVMNTVACVAARTFDSYTPVDALNNLSLNLNGTVAQSNDYWGQVSVFGKTTQFISSRPQWNPGTNLDSGVSFSPSTSYFLYMNQVGTPIISDQYPLNRRDLKGLYHPRETWRCLGAADTNSVTAFQAPVKSFGSSNPQSIMFLANPAIYGTSGYSSLSNNGSLGMTPYFPASFTFAYSNGVSTFTGSNGTYANVATLSLTPGIWALNGAMSFVLVGGTPTGVLAVKMGISQDTGTASFNDAVASVNLTGTSITASGTTPVQLPAAVNQYFVVTGSAAQTPVILKGFTSITGGNATFNMTWGMQAQRIDSLNGMPR